MYTITVKSLNGIPGERRDEIYRAARNWDNKQRLVICLYFMSDLSNINHHLSDIERNLRLIYFPLERDNMPDKYKDFQASCIRHYFNKEKERAEKGQLSKSDRLWKNVGSGEWRNTKEMITQ